MLVPETGKGATWEVECRTWIQPGARAVWVWSGQCVEFGCRAGLDGMREEKRKVSRSR